MALEKATKTSRKHKSAAKAPQKRRKNSGNSSKTSQKHQKRQNNSLKTPQTPQKQQKNSSKTPQKGHKNTTKTARKQLENSSKTSRKHHKKAQKHHKNGRTTAIHSKTPRKRSKASLTSGFCTSEPRKRLEYGSKAPANASRRKRHENSRKRTTKLVGFAFALLKDGHFWTLFFTDPFRIQTTKLVGFVLVKPLLKNGHFGPFFHRSCTPPSGFTRKRLENGRELWVLHMKPLLKNGHFRPFFHRSCAPPLQDSNSKNASQTVESTANASKTLSLPKKHLKTLVSSKMVILEPFFTDPVHPFRLKLENALKRSKAPANASRRKRHETHENAHKAAGFCLYSEMVILDTFVH